MGHTYLNNVRFGAYNLIEFLSEAAEKNEKEAKGVKNTGFHLEQISKKEYSEIYETIVKIFRTTWKLPDIMIKSVFIPLFGTERAYCGLFAFRARGNMKFSKDVWNIRRETSSEKGIRKDSPTPPPQREINKYLEDKYSFEEGDHVLSTPPPLSDSASRSK